MPKSPVQRVLRIVVPLSVLLAGVVIAIAIGRATAPSAPTPAPQPDQVARDTEPEAPERDPTPDPAPDPDPDPTREPDPDPSEGREPTPDAPEAPEADPPETEPEAGFSLDGLRARIFEEEPRDPEFDTLGGVDPDGPYRMAIRFSRYGAGLAELDLATHFDTIERLDHTTLQREYDYTDPVTSAVDGVTPFSALRLLIGDQSVPLQAVPDEEGYEQRIWRQTAPGVFEAEIINENDEPVVRIERRFELDPDSYEFRLRQRLDNLTDGPLNVRLIQHGPTQLRQEAAYGGEHRRVRFGYLESITRDPGQSFVVADGDLMRRNRAIETEDPTLWPNAEAIERDRTLVWLAQTNRYFGVAAYPLIDPSQDRPAKTFGTVQSVQRAVLRRGLTEPVLTLQLNGTDLRLEPGEHGRLDMAVYAGPLSTPLINRHDRAASLGIDGLVTYSFGGPCAWCTFTWLTQPLLGLLRFLQAYLVFDWALAIICLVVFVRSILHPVTRWSQSRMLIFGKQMQELGPKQRKIQEKYKHDRKQLQQEMAKLWREEGVSPAGFLGCLPMLLQTPIWIALYAMLFYAVELRHEPAFFGFFQGVTGGYWRFLGDLSEADRAIWFGGAGFSIPILSNLWGSVNSINILPLILGLVFYAHQKYMTPQSLDSMTPEQQQQQKIMRVMMVVLFPLIMYNAPSGLALYFIANSSLGIVESRWIRSNLEKRGMLDIENIRKHKQSKPGFLQRFQQAAEYQQQKKALKEGKVPPPGAGGGRAVRRAAAKQAQRKEDAPAPDRFKKKKKRR